MTLLLKLVFHKCFVNKFNLYNQVGLIALNCMGEMHSLGGGATGGVAAGSPQQIPRASLGPMYNSVSGGL